MEAEVYSLGTKLFFVVLKRVTGLPKLHGVNGIVINRNTREKTRATGQRVKKCLE